jgi:hypothetical protein
MLTTFTKYHKNVFLDVYFFISIKKVVTQPKICDVFVFNRNRPR